MDHDHLKVITNKIYMKRIFFTTFKIFFLQLPVCLIKLHSTILEIKSYLPNAVCIGDPTGVMS